MSLCVTCGRRPGKNFLTYLQHWSGAVHVSGLLMQPIRPLALMLLSLQFGESFRHFVVWSGSS
jgi:hypothetical protein